MRYGRIGRTQALSRVTGCIILPVLRSLGDVSHVVVRKDIIWEGGADGEGLKGESIRCSNWVYYRTWQTARLGTMHFTSRAVMTNLVISHLTSFYGRTTLGRSFCGKQHVTVRWKGLLYAEPGRRTRADGMLCYVSSSLQVLLFSPFLLNVTNRADLKLFNDGEQTMGLQ